MTKRMLTALLLLACSSEYVSVTSAFQCSFSAVSNAAATARTSSSIISTVALRMAGQEEEDLLRASKSKRSADVGDRLVTLNKPLGVVLNQDEKGNVYVETLAPRGNAARSGLVKEGDYVVMCSATFGDDLWPTRGVGLTRVLTAIKVRTGPTVKLVFESPTDSKRKALTTSQAVKAAEEARVRAQEKRDSLLKELQQDEQQIKKGKFLGLF